MCGVCRISYQKSPPYIGYVMRDKIMNKRKNLIIVLTAGRSIVPELKVISEGADFGRPAHFKRLGKL